MPLGTTFEELWKKIIDFLRFGARIPVAGLVIAAAGFLSFLVFMVLFRFTEWAWTNWLSHAW